MQLTTGWARLSNGWTANLHGLINISRQETKKKKNQKKLEQPLTTGWARLSNGWRKSFLCTLLFGLMEAHQHERQLKEWTNPFGMQLTTTGWARLSNGWTANLHRLINISRQETKKKKNPKNPEQPLTTGSVSYTHLRAHETKANLVCRLLLEKKK